MSGSDSDGVLDNWEDESVPENWEQVSVDENDNDASTTAASPTTSGGAAAAPSKKKIRKVGADTIYEEDPWAAAQFERLQAEYDVQNTVHKEYNSEDLVAPLLIQKVSRGAAEDYISVLAKTFRESTSTGLGHGPVVDALKKTIVVASSALGTPDLEQLMAALERSKSDAEAREQHARDAKIAEKAAKAAAKKAAEDKSAEDAALAAAAAEAKAKAEAEAAKLAQVQQMDDDDFM